MKRNLSLLALVMTFQCAIAQERPAISVVINHPALLVENINSLMPAFQQGEENLPDAGLLLGEMLLVDRLDGIDLDSPVEFFLTQSPDDVAMTNPIASVRFRLTDNGQQYLESLDQRFATREERGEGLYYLHGRPEDDKAVWLSIKGQTAVYAASEPALDIASEVYTPGESSYLSSQRGGISAVFSPAWIQTMWGSSMDQAVEKSEDPKTDAIADLFNRYMGGLPEQLAAMILQLDIDSDLALRIHLQAKDGTLLDQLIDAHQAPSPLVSGYSDESAIFYLYGSLGGVDLVMDKYSGFIGELYEVMGPPMDAMAASLQAYVREMKGIYSGGFSLFVYPGNENSPVTVAGAYDVSNPEAARQSLDKLLQIQSELGASESNAAASVAATRISEESYRGVEIERYTYPLAGVPHSTESTGLPLPTIPTNMSYHVAFDGNLMMYSVGGRDPLINLIDHALKGEVAGSPLPVFSETSGETVGFWAFDFGAAIRAIGDAASVLGLDGLEARMRGFTLKEAGGITQLITISRDDLEKLGSALGAAFATPSSSTGNPDDDWSSLEDPVDEYEDSIDEGYIEEEAEWPEEDAGWSEEDARWPEEEPAVEYEVEP